MRGRALGPRLGALAVGALLAAHGVELAPASARPTVLGVAAVALAACAGAAAWPRGPLAGIAPAALLGELALALALGPRELDELAPLAGVGLLLLVELLDLAAASSVAEPALRLRRLRYLAAVSATGLVAGAVVLVAGSLAGAGDVASVRAPATLAAAGALLMLALLARRAARSEPPS